MSDNTTKKLIVPVNLDGICLGEETISNPFAASTASFVPLKDINFNFNKDNVHNQKPLLDDDSLVEIFGDSTTSGKGVYLHWTFPAAILHGTQYYELTEDVLSDLEQQGISTEYTDKLKGLENKKYKELPVFRSAVSKALTGHEHQTLWFQGLIESAAASMSFPNLPNRWLVARIQKGNNTPKFWLVESDYMSTENIYGDNHLPFLDSAQIPSPHPHLTDQNNKKPFMRFMGRVRSLDKDWPTDAGADEQAFPNLTVMGYGAMSFSGYLPNSKNVFAFKDPLNDLGNSDQVKDLAYMVTGWYSDSAKDPLGQSLGAEQVDTLLKAYHWEVPEQYLAQQKKEGPKEINTEILSGISGSVFSGFLKGVEWDPAHAYFEDPEKDSSDVEVILANSSMEALAAYVGHGKEKIGQLSAEQALHALQMGILPQVLKASDEEGVVEEAFHTSGFGSEDGGYIWQVQSIKNTPSPNASPGTHFDQITHDKKEELPKLPDHIGSALNKLNTLQKGFDDRRFALDDRRSRLYDLWYWYNRWSYNPAIDMQDPVQMEQLNKELELAMNLKQNEMEKILLQPKWKQIFKLGIQQEAHRALPDFSINLSYQEYQLGQSIQQINHGIQHIQLALKQAKLDHSYQLALVPAARYWHPNDPVLLVVDKKDKPAAKMQNQEGRGFLHPSKQSPFLICRITSQIIQPNSSRINGLQSTSDKLGSLTVEQIDVFNKLLKELDFLDQQDLTKIKTGTAVTGKASGYVPAKLAMTRWGRPIPATASKTNGVNRKNPWVPILLQYSFDYYYPDDGNNYSKTSITDKLQLDIDHIDLKYKAGGVLKQATYQGSVVLSHQAETTLKDQLEGLAKKVAKNPTISELQKMVAQMPDHSILNQAINGFYDNLLTKQRGLKLGVYDPYEKDRHSSDSFANKVKRTVGKHQQTVPNPQDAFNPIQSGFVKITRIRIIDAFGQYKDITSPSILQAEAFNPEKRTLSATAPAFTFEGKRLDWPALFALPTRFASSTRLDFRWLSATDDQVEMNTHPATSPICGWIVPNKLDESLMIFEANGKHLGALQSLDEGVAKISWVPAPLPDNSIQEIKPQQIANPHLKNFVVGLLEQTDTEKFNQFRSTIDRVLLTIEPPNTHQETSMAVLMGRPLALVQATLNLQCKGLSDVDLTVASMTDFTNGKGYKDRNYTSVEIQVRLGDLSMLKDGLVGYFKYNGKQIEVNADTFQAEDRANSVYLNLKDTDPTQLLMLVDPRAKVHATCGVLPVKSIEIPPDQFADTLRKLAFNFLVNPVLSPTQLSMPLPTETKQPWSWLSKNKEGKWNDAVREIKQPKGPANPEHPVLNLYEGWLNMGPLPPKKYYKTNIALFPDHLGISSGGVKKIDLLRYYHEKIPASANAENHLLHVGKTAADTDWTDWFTTTYLINAYCSNEYPEYQSFTCFDPGNSGNEYLVVYHIPKSTFHYQNKWLSINDLLTAYVKAVGKEKAGDLGIMMMYKDFALVSAAIWYYYQQHPLEAGKKYWAFFTGGSKVENNLYWYEVCVMEAPAKGMVRSVPNILLAGAYNQAFENENIPRVGPSNFDPPIDSAHQTLVGRACTIWGWGPYKHEKGIIISLPTWTYEVSTSINVEAPYKGLLRYLPAIYL